MARRFNKEKAEDEVEATPQYPFEREDFCKTFYEVFGKDFDWFDLFYNKEYKAFVLWYNEDTWYIHYQHSKITVSWYKHLGRINQCSNTNMDLSKLKAFFELLKQDYEGEIDE